jgi:hypothetical protein
LEATVLRIVRIALLTLIPTLAIGTQVTACSDDTTSVVGADLSVGTPHDMATPIVHDLAQPGD